MPIAAGVSAAPGACLGAQPTHIDWTISPVIGLAGAIALIASKSAG